MKKIVTLIMVLTITCICFGDTLSPASSVLTLSPVETTNTTFTDALTVGLNMPSAGNALVFSTFSCQSSKGAKTLNSFRLETGGSGSTPIDRYLSGASDRGIASTVHVFSGLSSGSNTIALQQKAGTQATAVLGANLIAVPLVTDQGNALNYGLGQTTTASNTTSISYQATNISTSVTVDYSGGGVMLASSFTCSSGGTDTTGDWIIQYKSSGSSTWINAGNKAQRHMSGTDDTGAGTLYAMLEGVSAGTYDTRVAFRSEDGDQVNTVSGTIAAVALSYDEGDGGYFPTLSATSSGSQHEGTGWQPISGATDDIYVAGTDEIVAAMSFTGISSAGNATGDYDLELLLDGTSQANSQDNQRLFSSADDYGSGGAAGLFTTLNDDTFTIRGRHNEDTPHITSSNISLVGFSTGSIPEPATTFIVLAGGTVLLLKRRRKI